MKSYWGVLLFGFVTFTSCNPTQLIPQEARINLDEGNLSKINGRYDNNSSDSIRWRKTVFWSHLKPFLEDYYNEALIKRVISFYHMTVQLAVGRLLLFSQAQ